MPNITVSKFVKGDDRKGEKTGHRRRDKEVAWRKYEITIALNWLRARVECHHTR